MRGQTPLDDETLHGHLKGLLRLDNIGVLLGAGASAGKIGGKTMAQVWANFQAQRTASHQFLVAQGFVKADTKSVDVERLADALQFAGLEWQRVSNPALPTLEAAIADLKREVVLASLLQRDWWGAPGKVVAQPEALADHVGLLRKLCGSRQPGQPAPWAFSTNYDLGIEWAAEAIGLKYINGFDGLHYRGFAPHNFDLGYRNILARGEARFGTYNVYLAKLHGSLTWLKAGDDVVEAPTTSVVNNILGFADGTIPIAPEMVFPSAAKYQQTVGFLLGELFRRFTEFLSRPQTCLITNGYSFADAHINRLLLTALQNPTLQLVIYHPELAFNDSGPIVTNCAPWIQRLLALKLGQVTFVGGGEAAWFTRLVEDLPDPAIFDEEGEQVRRALRDLGQKIENEPKP
jgi:hypothetical protein